MVKKASFVPIVEQHTKRFKYFLNLPWIIKIKDKFQSLKRLVKTPLQGFKLIILKLDWKSMTKDASLWFVESFIEGLTANYVTSNLFGLDFNIKMILAHGFFIKQGLDLVWRLRNNGSISKILTKNK